LNGPLKLIPDLKENKSFFKKIIGALLNAADSLKETNIICRHYLISIKPVNVDKALQKAANSVYCTFAKFKTWSSAKFLNVSKMSR